MRKLGGLIALGLVVGIGASRLLRSKGYGVTEKARGRAESIKGRVEQVVGKATGSEETQTRGMVDEATGKAREKIAEIKGNAMASIDEAAA